MAKAAASDMYRKVASTGIQLHGGIGMTFAVPGGVAKGDLGEFGALQVELEVVLPRVAQLMTP
jgi:hypothetical protein